MRRMYTTGSGVDRGQSVKVSEIDFIKGEQGKETAE